MAIEFANVGFSVTGFHGHRRFGVAILALDRAPALSNQSPERLATKLATHKTQSVLGFRHEDEPYATLLTVSTGMLQPMT